MIYIRRQQGRNYNEISRYGSATCKAVKLLVFLLINFLFVHYASAPSFILQYPTVLRLHKYRVHKYFTSTQVFFTALPDVAFAICYNVSTSSSLLSFSAGCSIDSCNLLWWLHGILIMLILWTSIYRGYLEIRGYNRHRCYNILIIKVSNLPHKRAHFTISPTKWKCLQDAIVSGVVNIIILLISVFERHVCS